MASALFGLALLPLLAAAQNSSTDASSSTGFVCQTGPSGAAYVGEYTYNGCYLDRSVSILSAAKLSTIAMTPQFCATYCGSRGFGWGGINFGT